jgi:hypothetical protein
MTVWYKVGSRLQSVWEKYESEGSEAAIAHGLSVDVSLGTLKQWTRMWEKGNVRPGVPFPETNGAALSPTSTRAAPLPRPMVTKPTVVVKWNRDRVAFLIEKGPEVSIVRWGDTREDRAFGNEQLEFGEEK